MKTISRYKNIIIIYLLGVWNRYHLRGKVKIFCIGRNKTGTTSLKRAFKDLGFSVGYQRKAETLYDCFYFQGEFKPIIDYCLTAQVFQDVPFSCPETYKHLDTAYPGSKFILSVRDDGEQWYRSITRFHAKKFGKEGRLPTVEDLKNAIYVRKGFPYNTVRLHGTTDNAPYHKEILIAHYERHNREVMAYFKDRPDDLLVINLAEPGSYKQFVKFLGVNSPYDRFPWEKKTTHELIL
jgi:Sulfotransferase domain